MVKTPGFESGIVGSIPTPATILKELSILKKFIALLLVFALCLALCLPASAVAGIDDAAMAVALWFVSAAGLTFGTAGDAFAAMQKFLSDQAETLSEVVSIVTEDVKDGVLSLRASKKAIYSSLIAAIKSYFTSTADDSGALSGTISTGGIYSPVSASSWKNYTSYRFPVGQDFILKTGSHSYYWEYLDGLDYNTYPADGYYFYKDGFSPNRYPNYTFGVFMVNAAELLSQFGISGNAFDFLSVDGCIGLKYYTVNNGALLYSTYLLSNSDGVFNNAPDLTIEFVGDNITYLQDAAVDGASAVTSFDSLPSGDNDDDEPIPISIDHLTRVVENGQSSENGSDGTPLKDSNPDVVPADVIQQLQDAIKNASGGSGGGSSEWNTSTGGFTWSQDGEAELSIMQYIVYALRALKGKIVSSGSFLSFYPSSSGVQTLGSDSKDYFYSNWRNLFSSLSSSDANAWTVYTMSDNAAPSWVYQLARSTAQSGLVSEALMNWTNPSYLGSSSFRDSADYSWFNLMLDAVTGSAADDELSKETDDIKDSVTDYVKDKKSNYGDSLSIGNTISDGLKPDMSADEASSAISGLFSPDSSDYWGWFSSETDSDLHPNASDASTYALDDSELSSQDVADSETVWVINPFQSASDLISDFFGGD